MSYQCILSEQADGVLAITLNRPDKLNSFNARMAEECLHALAQAQNDPAVRAVVLTGAGRAFCAGQDLAEATAPGVRIEDLVERQYNALIRALRNLEKPVIAAVNGVAAGAGANIAYACDLSFAAQSAVFVQSFIHIGLIPDSGGTYVLPRLVGMQRTFGQMILADKLPAERAMELGLIWKALPDAELMPEVMAVAKKLAHMPTKGIALTKKALNLGQANSLEEQLETEKALQAAAGASQDSQEGIRAFLEKRKPVFRGD